MGREVQGKSEDVMPAMKNVWKQGGLTNSLIDTVVLEQSFTEATGTQGWWPCSSPVITCRGMVNILI
jgi:hypothetical protein